MNKSLTEDIRLLPPASNVRHRINKEVMDLANNIKDQLIQKEPQKDGSIKIIANINPILKKQILGELRKWAKIQNYYLKCSDSVVMVIPKQGFWLDFYSSKLFNIFIMLVVCGLVVGTGVLAFNAGVGNKPINQTNNSRATNE